MDEVHVHVHGTGDRKLRKRVKRIEAQLVLAIDLLLSQGVQMSELQDAIDALQGRISEDVDHLLDLVAEANDRAEAAAANDAADAAEIARLRDENAAALADAQAAVDRIKNIDPDASFPPAPEEPPVEEPPVEEPVVEEPVVDNG